ncbi:MAG: metalloregulator ArsR/SmtB family transcription factor [Robiginitomaculum sp.]|nr:metalloregulator ArsR/SmtB family transcription factor [Robiginitomaculum sp.]
MPSRQVVAKELAEVFGLLSHPDRIRMIEELRLDEKDVSGLAKALGLEAPRISQHLRLLKAHRIVVERREGRHHFYHLINPDMANWIVNGLEFIERRHMGVTPSNIKAARRLWSD